MDVPNREGLEVEMARILAKLGRQGLTKLKQFLGDPPNLANVPEAFWTEYGTGLRVAITAVLQNTYLAQAEAIEAALPAIGFDWGLVNERAAAWARAHAGELERLLMETTRRAIGEAIGRAFEEGLTLEQVTDLISKFFGPKRAEAIAITEITRAASEAEQEVARQVAGSGIQMIAIWQTNEDEKVCFRCGPRDGQPITDGVYPPLHTRCRCWCNHQLPKVT